MKNNNLLLHYIDCTVKHITAAERKEVVATVHGLFGHSANWRSVLAKVSERVPWGRFLSVDAPNHGASPHCGTYAYPVMSDALVRLLDDLRVERAHLIGHSMGGKIAMTTALRHPDRIASVVSVDIAPCKYNSLSAESRQVLEAMYALDLSAVHSRRDADAALAAGIPSPMLRGFVLQNLIIPHSHGAGERPRWRVDVETLRNGGGMAQLADWDDTLPPFPNPALFLAGARSDYISNEGQRSAIARNFPHAATRIAVIANAGHWVHSDNPSQLVDEVVSFYQRNHDNDTTTSTSNHDAKHVK